MNILKMFYIHIVRIYISVLAFCVSRLKQFIVKNTHVDTCENREGGTFNTFKIFHYQVKNVQIVTRAKYRCFFCLPRQKRKEI